MKGDYSGRPDDRWIFSTTNPYLQWNAIAALAAAADSLKGWDDSLAKDALETAIEAWNDETNHPTPNPARDSSGLGAGRAFRIGCVGRLARSRSGRTHQLQEVPSGAYAGWR